jgi:biopolymer transport protein ExbD
MAKRSIPEINAGSMADIAFLLLIFFLVTTTMDKDTGMLRQMSVKIDVPLDMKIDVRKRNLMKIRANAQNQIQVRSEITELSELKEKVDYFYRANMVSEVDGDYPEYLSVTKYACDTSIAAINKFLDNLEDDSFVEFKEAERKEWEKRLKVIETLKGPYREMHRSGAIQIELQTKTHYEILIAIMNEVKAAINDIRDEKGREIFGQTYRSMVQRRDLDGKGTLFLEEIQLLEILVPERIVELKPADLQ